MISDPDPACNGRNLRQAPCVFGTWDVQHVTKNMLLKKKNESFEHREREREKAEALDIALGGLCGPRARSELDFLVERWLVHFGRQSRRIARWCGHTGVCTPNFWKLG